MSSLITSLQQIKQEKLGKLANTECQNESMVNYHIYKTKSVKNHTHIVWFIHRSTAEFIQSTLSKIANT